jgi:adenine-specific DNA-methyltransferase
MAAKFPYYLLSDSSDGVKKETEVAGKLPPSPLPKTESDIKKGFVYKRVPHITLKSIANNEEIDAIHAKWQEKLEPIRAELNKLLKRGWQEWQIPGPNVIARSEATKQSDTTKSEIASLGNARNDDEKWMIIMNGEEVEIKGTAKEKLAEWWKLRRERQKEIDESIARHADTELLYDQPYEDNRRIRVTGPFTVESLSPHRVLSTADENLDGTVSEKEARQQHDFVSMILDNLRKSGVQNIQERTSEV